METSLTRMSFSVDGASLAGTLELPPRARALIILTDGTDGLGPENIRVAEHLREVRLGTLILGLLTPGEVDLDRNTGHWRGDVAMLARRLRRASLELRGLSPVRDLRMGYCGNDSGSAAALIAAAELPQAIRAVVSGGGRPDMAGQWLPRVHAPTLLIAGSEDHFGLASNRDALGKLHAATRLEVVSGASRGFPEPGALDQVADLAAGWFTRHMLHSGRRWLGPRFEDHRFHDRAEAGRMLAAELGDFAHRSDVMVLALPRGGVPVAYEVALALGAELDVLNVRKLGFPGHEELAVGAVAAGGVRVLNTEELRFVSDDELERITRRERRALERLERRYREGRPAPTLRNRTVILVDDGLATGATMRAAIAAVRTLQPERIIVAVPVAPATTCSTMAVQVDELVCLVAPELFFGVGQWYEDFSPCRDADVRALVSRLEQALALQEAS